MKIFLRQMVLFQIRKQMKRNERQISPIEEDSDVHVNEVETEVETLAASTRNSLPLHLRGMEQKQ